MKGEMRRWYLNNKERQYKNIYRYIKENRKQIRETRYVNVDHNREKILKILPKKCTYCNKSPIKIIHHETYDLLPRQKSKKPKDKLRYLTWYCKYLKPFCSMECHQRYHRKPTPKTPRDEEFK